jgi:futalosine hydrolase
MSSVLIVAATEFELEPLLRELSTISSDQSFFLRSCTFKNKKIDVAITGAGMVNTAFYLGQLNGKKYDQVINAGICGVFKDEIKIGDVVNITEDVFSDFGAQDDETFLSISQMNLGSEHVKPEHAITGKKIEALQKCKGITVNTVHGNEAAIKKIMQRLDPDVESMEGASFFVACNHYKWPCVQIRAVSNRVEKRDKDRWNIPLAIKNLNEFLIDYLKAN